MPMQRDFGLFFAANDTEETISYPFSGVTISTGATASVEGQLITVNDSTGGTGGSLVGQATSLLTATKRGYGTITKAPDGTHFHFLPKRSESDDITYGTDTFTTSDTFTTESQVHCTLVIDLTDAPEGTYNYLVMATAQVSNATASQTVHGYLVTSAPVDDAAHPYAAGRASATVDNASYADWYAFGTARTVTLEAGQRHDIHLTVANGKMKNGRLTALRYGKSYEVTYDDASVTSTTSSGGVEVASVTIPNGTSLSYLIVMSGAVRTVTGTATVKHEPSVPTDPQILDMTINTSNDSDRVSFCAASVQSLPGAQELWLYSDGTNTSYIYRPFVFACSLDQLYVQNLQGNDAYITPATSVSGATTAAWATTQTSSAVTLDGGEYLELVSVSASKDSDGRYGVRPVWGAAATERPHGRGWYGHPRAQQGMFMQRTTRPSGSATNSIQTQNVTGSGTCSLKRMSFVWIRPYQKLDVRESTPLSIVAEVESLLMPRRWTNVSSTLYRVTLTGVSRVSRVLVNGVEYDKALDQPNASGSWYWNPEPSTSVAISTTTTASHTQETASAGTSISVTSGTGFAIGRRIKITDGSNSYHADIISGSGTTWTVRGRTEVGDTWDGTTYASGSTVTAALGSTLYVYLPSGDAPSDSDVRIAVYATHEYGRKPEDLTDEDRWVVPFEPRLANVPTVSQELDVRGESARVSTSFGEMRVVNADGAYDDTFARRPHESGRARVRLGYSSLSSDLRDFETIIRASLGMATWSPEELRLRLFDQASTLTRPLLAQSIMVFEGTGGTMREHQAVPILYGEVKRVPGYRVTNVTGSTSGTNWWKVCGHRVISGFAAYRTAESLTPISLTVEDRPNGLVGTTNTNSSGGGSDPPDTLWFDTDGMSDDDTSSGRVLTGPGEILEDLLTRYPQTPDGTVQLSTTSSTGTFTQPSGYSTATLNVTSAGSGETAIPYAGRLRITNGSNRCHVQVVTKSGTTLTVVALQDSGDTAAGTTYAVGSTVEWLLPSSAALATTEVARATFRLMDRFWRRRVRNAASLNGPVEFAAYFDDPAMTVAGAVDEICRQVFAYWYATREGRIAVGVPDVLALNACANAGFEYDSASYWPWIAGGGASVSVSGSYAFQGSRSVLVDASRNAQACVRQAVLLPAPGKYVATAMVALGTGSTDSATIGLIEPGDGFAEVLSEAVTASSTTWQRVTVACDVKGSGTGFVSVYPCNRADAVLSLSPVVHLRPEDLTSVVDTTAVTSWTSAAGSHVFTQGTGAKQPTIRDLTIGRRPVVRFDGGDVLARTGSYTSLGTASTIIAVVRFSSASGEHTICGEELGSSRFSYDFTSGTLRFAANGSTVATYTTALSANVWYVLGARRLSTAVAMNVGTAGNSTSFTEGSPAHFALELIGARGAAATTAPMTGDIAELLAFTTSLSVADYATAYDYLCRRHGLQDGTLRVDDVECYPVAAVLDESNCDIDSCEYLDENYYAARATFGVKQAAPQIAPAVVVTDNEARALAPLIYSESQAANPQAGLLDFGTTMLGDDADARAIAAPAAAYFGRLRQSLQVKALGLRTIPQVGQKLYIRHRRVPEPLDGYPLWTITRVELAGGNAQEIKLRAERQADPVSDRTTIV